VTRTGLLLAACLLLAAVAAHAQEPTAGPAAPGAVPARPPAEEYLTPGRNWGRELRGGEAHSYLLWLEAGQYVRAVVEQKGVDVAVRVYAPSGAKLAEVDSPNGAQGPEPAELIAETTGEYRVEVSALDGKAAAGRYEIRVEELRQATQQDRARTDAERVIAEAEQLRVRGTDEALREALGKYNEALPLLRSLKETGREAHVLVQVGWVFRRLGESAKSLEYYHRALPLWRALGEVGEESNTLSNIAVAFVSAGDGQKALEYYHQALALWRAAGNVKEEGYTLHNIGVVHWQLGDSQKALEYFNQALPLRRAAGDRPGEALTLLGIATTHESLGRLHEALEYYNIALTLLEAVGDPRGEATALTSIGSTYLKLGESQKAFGYYGRALTLIRAVGDRRQEASTLSSIGAAYWQPLGDSQKALEYLNQALSLWRAAAGGSGAVPSLRSGEASTLQRLGAIHGAEGDARRALEYLEQALSLARAIGNQQQEAYDLDTIGIVYGSLLGDPRKALELYEQALTLRRATGDRMGEAITLSHIGAAHHLSGRLEEAARYLRQALALHREVGDRNGEAETLKQAAGVERDLGHLGEAREQIEAALGIHEGARSQLYSQQLRATLTASRQDYYETYIDVLMRLHRERPAAGYDAEALRASERARARGLLEILTESRADIRQGVDAGLLERERSTRQRLSFTAERLTRLLGERHAPEQEAELRGEVESLLAEYQEVEARIREVSPRYAALTQPRPLGAPEIRRLLDKDTLLLEYSLGEERSYLWVLSSDGLQSFVLPRRAAVEEQARKVYELLAARNKSIDFEEADRRRERVAEADAEYPAAAGALSQMILAPAAALLKGKRLLVVGDGVLQYLPFAALPLPEAAARGPQAGGFVPLIAGHEVVSLPSASALTELRKETAARRPAPKAVAVLADPVFESRDGRVKANNTQTGSARPDDTGVENSLLRSVIDISQPDENRHYTFPRLPYTRREAEAIVALVPAGQSEKAVDFDASRAAATDPRLAEYRYVHFATHALLNTRHPELSGVVLSLYDRGGREQDGFLLAHEVYNLRLPAEMVTLSGCRTGLGKEVRGEGLVGLTRGFMYAGAARVLVSLWDVNDESTAELMSRLYRGVLKEGLSPAAALRRAQLGMWKEARWRAPYYWAPFVLHGEYR
jgi:CHAT domain-containing protein/Tfp pilus assembly protein PilF